jgi:hypothetical protein
MNLGRIIGDGYSTGDECGVACVGSDATEVLAGVDHLAMTDHSD